MILEMVFPLKCIIIMSKRYLLEMTGLIKLEHFIWFKTFHRLEISTQQREETGEAIEDPDKL